METYDLRKLGTRMKALRKAKKKTQDEVAEAIGVNKMTVSDWERGTKQPGFLNVLNYCNLLGITLDDLVESGKPAYLHLTFTEAERDTIFSMLAACQQEAANSPENTALHKTLRFLEQHLNAFLGRAEHQ